MTMTGDNGNLSIDFLVGFTIFLLAFIWVVSMIPGLLINLQGYTIDYDAVAYRTGVILAEDPGEPSLPTSINPWENLIGREGVVRFGLAVSKYTPNILSQKKVDRFFCLSVFSYPDDYQNRTIFGDYLYQFNISLVEMGSDHPPRYVGDIMPATSSYGSIRRLVKIKEPSIAVINASSFDITGNYDPTARPDLLSGENETVHEFIILINKSELLEDTVRDPIYQINPAQERTIINITHLDQTMPLDRKDCFNISLTKITIINEMEGLFVKPPIPNYKTVIDGVQYNQSSTMPYINNNISLLFDPPTYWSVIDKSYINLTFTLTPSSTCSGPGGIFSGPDPVRGSRFLNNTFTSPFGYNYSPKNVIQPQLRDAVLEINIGSGARTVTETVTEGLVAAFKWDWNVGGTPITVNFMDQSTGSHMDYDWDFGDGTPHGSINILTHTYTARGDYTVTLTVKNSTGGSATSPPQIIKIREITATTGAKGTISPMGAVLVPYGTNQAFTITPNTGYQIADVLVDGVSNGTISIYTFNNVVADHTISASFALALAPTVVSITPNTGVNTTTISITNLAGANFLAGATVKLNRTGDPDIPGTSVTVVSPTQITCSFDLTGKTSGLWNVAVTNADGQSGMLANGFTITAPAAAPTITSIAPATGVNTTTISITNLAGTNFAAGATVKLNRTGYPDIPGTSVTVVSPTLITCSFDLTGKTAGLWNVAVTNADGKSGMLANGFTITAPAPVPAPTIASITPNTGLNTTTISITNLAGTGFLAGAAVKLNRTGYADIPGTILTLSSTQITCTFDLTNKKTGLWNVAVTNPDGKSGVLPNGFTITAPRRTIFSDNFESGFTGWTAAGIPGTPTWYTGSCKNGSHSIQLVNQDRITRTIPTTGYSNIMVSSALGANLLESGEYVQAQYNTGAGWTMWRQIVDGGDNNLLQNFNNFALPASADNNAAFQLRFRLYGSAADDYGYIDDVLVTGIPD